MATSQGEYPVARAAPMGNSFRDPVLRDNKGLAHDGSAPPGRRRSIRMNRSHRHASEALSQSIKLQKESESSRMAIEGPGYQQPQALRCMSFSTDTEQQTTFSYTRTGRISKALKGKRVHTCDICEKQYTRAEHLRRHQLNHGTQLLQCDERDCKRKFRREDLLLKHKEKHDHDAYPDLSPSVGRPSSSASSEGSFTAITVPHEADSFGHSNTFPVMRNLPITTHIPLSREDVFSKHLPPQLDFPEIMKSSQPLSLPNPSDWSTDDVQSLLFTSPNPDFTFSSPMIPSSTSSNLSSLPLSELDPWGSVVPFITRPPTSASSAESSWPVVDGTQRLRSHSETPSLSNVSMINSHDATDYTLAVQELSELVRQQWPPITSIDERNLLEQTELLRDLAGVPGILLDSNRLPLIEYYQQQYLPLFWENFHPTFAVVHRPSFESMEDSRPLLTASMMAIGATYHNDWMAKTIARRLHETCCKLFDKRPTPTWETLGILDMQTIVLIEAFNQFRSRRMPPRLSVRFDSLYSILLDDPEVHSSIYLEVFTKLPYIISDSELEAKRTQWLTADSKRRVLLSCYVLNVQQTNLLKSPSKFRGVQDNHYVFPTSDALWEAPTLHNWHMLARKESSSPMQVYDALKNSTHLQPSLKSCFRSTVGIAYLSCNPEIARQPHVMQFFNEMDTSRQAAMGFHAAMLALHTPLRELLAISGESWILGEKLLSHEQYVQADIHLSIWINSDESKRAIWHSVQLLCLAATNISSGLLYEDWCLYLAALVCWSHGMWHRESELRDVSIHVEDIDMGMHSFLEKMGSAQTWRDVGQIEPSEAQICLSWVNQQISGAIGALIQDAAGVLKKLVAGERPRMTPAQNS